MIEGTKKGMQQLSESRRFEDVTMHFKQLSQNSVHKEFSNYCPYYDRKSTCFVFKCTIPAMHFKREKVRQVYKENTCNAPFF